MNLDEEQQAICKVENSPFITTNNLKRGRYSDSLDEILPNALDNSNKRRKIINNDCNKTRKIKNKITKRLLKPNRRIKIIIKVVKNSQ